MQQASRYCKLCEKRTLHAKTHMVGAGLGIILSLITLGLFIPVWIMLAVVDAFRPYRCQQCGKARLV